MVKWLHRSQEPTNANLLRERVSSATYFVSVPKPTSKHDKEVISAESVGVEGTVDVLGLKLFNASCHETHPSVAEVLPGSPLVGRIFEGDFILKLNGSDTIGYTSKELEQLLENKVCSLHTKHIENDTDSSNTPPTFYQLILLTIMSSRCDEFEEDTSSGTDNFDVSLLDGGIEV